MKEIIIKNSISEILIDSNMSYYMFSFYFILFLENEDKVKEDLFLDNKDKIKDLYDVLEKYLKKILVEWHQEPSEKEFQKHSTRYEKIVLNKKTYRVNYRMSEIGKLAYLIYRILQMLDNSHAKGESINIKIVHKE
ncbi:MULTISPECIES: hypothetical protein [Chryseobacterium]|uniref:Uncharacterized protein n=1 Tax=Chryseobacterium taihuense TaxID=1141221 RepID=A0A4U8WBP8_9FLAO|nr:MULTISPECIES: hypothetical protein [Chryseobacterium]QQV03163.1 hypothetical protein I6I61_02040 [Chryseobacterium sp. FDAARGOS 1104]VFB03533.1 Uncharacterised protein [Chryseobacterium taihuense]